METKKTLIQRIYDAKKEIGKIAKDSTNPFYKSKYFDINGLLEHIEPILFKHELVILQPIIDNKVITELVCIFDGERIKSEIELPKFDDPQKLGSAITYYRRYTLQSLLSLQAEDDDGNTATTAKPLNTTDDGKQWLNPGTPQWTEAIKWLSTGGKLETVEKKYKFSKANRELLLSNAI